MPTLARFASRYLEGYAKANRDKPSTIDSKESILRNHLIPQLGEKQLDQITQEDLQRLKSHLRSKSNKTTNNVLTVLNTMLKAALDWGIITRCPVEIRLLKVAPTKVEFYDFDDYESLVVAAQRLDPRILLVVLLAGDAGLRRGEIIGLEWTDLDLKRRLLTVERSEWKAHVTLPKGNRIRIVPLTKRLGAALSSQRHLRGPRVLYRDDGHSVTAKVVRTWLLAAQRVANLKPKGPHTLRHTFCSHLAMRGAPARAIQELAGHQNLTTTQRYMHLSPAALERAIGLLEEDKHHSAPQALGDIVETK